MAAGVGEDELEHGVVEAQRNGDVAGGLDVAVEGAVVEDFRFPMLELAGASE